MSQSKDFDFDKIFPSMAMENLKAMVQDLKRASGKEPFALRLSARDPVAIRKWIKESNLAQKLGLKPEEIVVVNAGMNIMIDDRKEVIEQLEHWKKR